MTVKVFGSAEREPPVGTTSDGGLGDQFLWYPNDVHHLATAMSHRVASYYSSGVFLGQLEPVSMFWKLNWFRNRVLARARLHPRISHREFCDMYTGLKRRRYERASADIERDGFDVGRDSQVLPFVKKEKYKITPDKPNPSPRTICPRDPKFTLEFGTYIKHNEHEYYHAIDEVLNQLTGSTTPTIVKGLNSVQIGHLFEEKWAIPADPRGVLLDVSRFEFHCTTHALKYEHSWYKVPFPECEPLCRAQLKNKLVGRVFGINGIAGIVKTTLSGRRMSGDINTGLGNIILMLSLIAEFCRIWGIPPLAVDNGDDCTLICDSSKVNTVVLNIEAFFRNYGFRLKVDGVVDRIEKIRFCRMSPVWSAFYNQYIMVREPYEACSKDHSSMSSKNYKEWLKAVSIGGLSMSKGMPILQEYYKMLARDAGDVAPADIHGGKFYYARGLSVEETEIHPLTRVSFWIAFGICPTEQCSLERKYASLMPPTGMSEGMPESLLVCR